MPNMGVCGDMCDYCPRYIATQSGSVEKLKEVAVLWFKAGARSGVMPAEEMACLGCSPQKAWSGYREIKAETHQINDEVSLSCVRMEKDLINNNAKGR